MLFKDYYEKKAAESYQLYRAAMADEDFKAAEYYFGEYERYKNVSKDTVRH